jgi:hypothetical protein
MFAENLLRVIDQLFRCLRLIVNPHFGHVRGTALTSILSTPM